MFLSPSRFPSVMVVTIGCALGASEASSAATGPAGKKDPVIEQHVIDAAMQKLQEKQKQRASTPTTNPATTSAASPGWSTSLSDPYGLQAVTARKLQMLRTYDGRIAEARLALRRQVLSPREVRRLVEERSELLQLPLDRLRALIMEVDRLNADRLTRFREAFGELPTAGKTVSVILMKSGLIDFATPLPDDPLTMEIEQARGVRRAYFQFYLSPKDASPRRYNGYIEFVYDAAGALWVPTWADFSGEPVALFQAEAFVPLRPYDIHFDAGQFVVAQAQSLRPPDLFTLLMPRTSPDTMMFSPQDRR